MARGERGGRGAGTQRYDPLATNPKKQKRQQPVVDPASSGRPCDNLRHLKQKTPMSCSLASIKMAGNAFGKNTGSEKAMLKKTESRKNGTYSVIMVPENWTEKMG